MFRISGGYCLGISSRRSTTIALSLVVCFQILGITACGNQQPSSALTEKLSESNTVDSETLIPRSMPGDKGKYYLLQSERNADIVSALHKRVGVDSVGYTRTETNCFTMKMREVGYSDISVEAIEVDPTKWFELVDGSSKSDLAKFVCAES